MREIVKITPYGVTTNSVYLAAGYFTEQP
jgi:hypothetical protein